MDCNQPREVLNSPLVVLGRYQHRQQTALDVRSRCGHIFWVLTRLFVPQTFVFESTTEFDDDVPILVDPVQWLEPETVLFTVWTRWYLKKHIGQLQAHQSQSL